MKIIFTAWLLVNGVWVHGSNFDGWWPIKAESEEYCHDMMVFANNAAPTHVLFTCETLEDTKENWREADVQD